MTIHVRYSCAGCGLEQTPLAVPARLEEDLMTWMDATMFAVHDDHHQRAPHCVAQHVDLFVPMAGDRVGVPAVH